MNKNTWSAMPAQLIKVLTYNLFSLKNVHINKENVNVGPDIIY